VSLGEADSATHRDGGGEVVGNRDVTYFCACCWHATQHSVTHSDIIFCVPPYTEEQIARRDK
jgi:hypothetical protein